MTSKIFSEHNVLARNLIEETATGIIGILMFHPFDTVRVRLQTIGQIEYYGYEVLYTSPFDCFYKIFKREGVRGLYKGLTVPIFFGLPINTLTFASYQVGKSFLYDTNTTELSYSQLFLIGSLSGALPTHIKNLFELIKIRVQVPNILFDYQNNPYQVFKHLVKTEKGTLLRGSLLTLLRDTPSTGFYFVGYEILFKKFSKISESFNRPEYNDLFTSYSGFDMSSACAAMAGGMAGVIFWLIALPFDSLKTKFQISPTETYPNGVRELFVKEVYLRKKPLRILYTGLSSTLICAFVSNAIGFAAFHFTLRDLRNEKILEEFVPKENDRQREEKPEEENGTGGHQEAKQKENHKDQTDYVGPGPVKDHKKKENNFEHNKHKKADTDHNNEKTEVKEKETFKKPRIFDED